MSESHHSQPNSREAEVREGLTSLEATLNYADSLPEDHADRLKINEALFQAIDGHVQNDPYFSGGHTIPGTDEWIPGERHDRYTYNTEDSKTGEKYSIALPTEFGQRLEAFATAQRPVMEAKQQAAAEPAAENEPEAVVLPFEKPKSTSKKRAKATTSHESTPATDNDHQMAARVAKLAASLKRAGSETEKAAEPATQPQDEPASSPAIKVTTRQRGGAHRAQGPASKVTAAAKDSEPKHRKSSKGVTHKRDAIADLVELDASGRARYQAGAVEHVRDKDGAVVRDSDNNPMTRGIAARFMSKYELSMIEAYQDLIRDGLADRNKIDTDDSDKQSDEPQVVAPIVTGLDGLIDTADQTATPAAFDPNVAPTPAAQVARKTLRQRFKAVLNRAGKELYLLPQTLKEGAGKVVEYLNDTEKGRRRGIVAGVVGVAAVGGAMLASKYGSDVFGHASHAHGAATGGGAGGANKELLDVLNGQDGAKGTGAGEAIRSHMTLHQGDTIWSDIASSASRHGHHLSDEQIQHLTQQTLNANGLSWEDARHLPVGYRFEVPEEVRAQLLSGKVA